MYNKYKKFNMAPDPKLTARVMKLKWSKGISLKDAWKLARKKKAKKDKKGSDSTKKGTGSIKVKMVKKVKKVKKTEKEKKPVKKSSIKKEINGKMRTIYTSSRGAKYYKSKGTKVYVK